jgi:hypothetical protein
LKEVAPWHERKSLNGFSELSMQVRSSQSPTLRGDFCLPAFRATCEPVCTIESWRDIACSSTSKVNDREPFTRGQVHFVCGEYSFGWVVSACHQPDNDLPRSCMQVVSNLLSLLSGGHVVLHFMAKSKSSKSARRPSASSCSAASSLPPFWSSAYIQLTRCSSCSKPARTSLPNQMLNF